MKLENTYTQLPALFYSYVEPQPVSKPKLLSFNHELAGELGIDLSQDLTRVFSGNELIKDTKPIALNYCGHQFGHFNPQLGDGRAILLTEVRNPKGELFDIQLKGSGQTPYSRNGDGRSALGPVIREYLMSEAMFHLGIPTTRALCAIESGDVVQRETLLKGGIFTRVASSHIRIGTFEYFSSRSLHSQLRQLADYTIQRHYPELNAAENPYLELFRSFSHRYLKLVSEWMRVGFIHGVMNTDNTALSGETIDYGPCAFLDQYHHKKVFSSIDRHARYHYSNQGPIACWNLSAFASCLIPLIDENQEKSISLLESELALLPARFEGYWLNAMASKLGIIQPQMDQHKSIITSWLQYLETHQLDFTQTHRRLLNADLPQELKTQDFYQDWKKIISEQDHKVTQELMEKANPFIIPRNHLIEQAIAQAYASDYDLFYKLQKIFMHPYEESEDGYHYAQPPEQVNTQYKTFCGT